MAKFSPEVNAADIAQLTAILDGTVIAHSGAIVNLQNQQVTQADAIDDLETEQASQDGRITALENP